MAQQVINVGTTPNDGTGDPIRTGFTKVNDNFTETYAAVPDHVALADPHTQYQKESEKGAAGGYAALDGSGTVPDAQIPAGIARDAEVTAAIAAHEGAGDPHTVYQRESEKGAASGYASLDGTTKVPTAELGSGVADATTFLRGDRTWAAPPAGGADGLGPDGDKGDVTVGGTGTTLTIDTNAVTYAKMQDVSATSRILGRITAGAGDPEELTGTQATTLLDIFTDLLKGLVPASGGGTTTFLRADGTFAAPTAAAADPSYAPGSFTVVTETARPFFNHLKLTGSQRATLQGTARLRLHN